MRHKPSSWLEAEVYIVILHAHILILELHRYAFFHICRYRLFAYSFNRYADIYRYSSFLQNRGGGAENHLKFMRINCICNDNVINVINYVGGRLLQCFTVLLLSPFMEKEAK